MPIDYKRYPPNWKTEIRPAVLERAQCLCEWCGAVNGSMEWRGKKKIKGRFITSRYTSKEHAIADGCMSCIEHTKSGRRDTRIYQTKIVLTIAHLDHDETNWDVQLDRLAALCQLCHLKYDAKEKYRRVMNK